MKRNLISVLMLLFVTVLLVGCDFFGGNTTITTDGNTHIVVFFDGDEVTPLDTQNVPDGTSATSPATLPTKDSTAQYDYVFAGWDKDFSSVTGPMTIFPIFTSVVREYTVVFENWDGTELKTETVEYGSGATAPANPTRPDTEDYTYTFTGWDVSFSNITGDLTVTATYNEILLQSFAVTFEDWDGTEIEIVYVQEGEDATPPANPTRVGDAQYSYVFAGWNGTYTNVTADVTITATYTQTVNNYTVVFQDSDGTELDSQQVAYGSAATAPTDPAKAADAQYTYTFTGWDNDFSNITGNLTVTAEYSSVLNQYTVTFKDWDDTVLHTQVVDYGTGATAPADPTRAATLQYTYTFANWDVDFSNIVADLDVVAVYTQTVIQYTVTFYNEDQTVLDTQLVDYGSAAIAPTAPTKADSGMYTYAFAGWDVDFSNITGNLDVYAMFDESVITFEVAFHHEDGTLIETVVVDYGDDAIAPPNPFKPADLSNAYEFVGWDHDITNVTSDLVVTAVFNAVPLDTYYPVYFYDAYDNVIDVQNIMIGGAAIAPAAPFKNPDAGHSFTFDGWDTEFAVVNSELHVHPTYIAVANQYTVEFVDWDGTVLHTEVVDHGMNATAPTNPTRPDDVDWRYTFIGWDMTYMNVQADLSIHAIYHKTALGAFDEAMLQQLVIRLFNPWDVEETIGDLLLVFEIENNDKEALYNELLVVEQLYLELQFINNAADIQAWYTSLATYGFTSEKLVNMLYNAMVMGMTNDLGWLADEILYVQGEIANRQQELADAEAMMAQIVGDATSYCATTLDEALCLSYFNQSILIDQLRRAYEDSYWRAGNDNEYWEYWTYDDLVWYLEQVEYYTYWYVDQDEAAYWQAQYDSLWNYLTLEEQQMYQPYLDMLAAYKAEGRSFNNTDWSPLLNDNGTGIVPLYYIESLLFGYPDEFDNYVDGYFYYVDMMAINQWQIEEHMWWLEDLENRLDNTQAWVNYITSVDGENEVKALMMTGYDILDAVVTSVDQDTFEFVYGLLMMTMNQPDLNKLAREMEEYNPLKDLLNPETILFVAQKLNMFLTAIEGTLTPEDFDNAQTVLLGYLDELLTIQGMDPTEEAAFLASLDLQLDDYETYIRFIIDTLQSVTAGMTAEKVEMIINTIGTDFWFEPTQIGVFIHFADLFNQVLGDGSIDFETAFGYLTEIYFDVSTGFMADPTVVADTKAAVVAFITDTLTLVDSVSALDPTYVSPAEVESIYELLARVTHLGMVFDRGFEHINDPYTVYEDYYINMFMHMVMNEWDIDNAILKYLQVFELVEEEDLFYTMMSVMQYLMGVNFSQDFADMQYWVANLESFGFTQSELIGYLMNLVKIEVDYATNPEWFQDELNYLNQMIDEYEQYIIDAQALLDDLDQTVASFIATMDPLYQANATDYWGLLKALEAASMVSDSAFYALDYEIGYTDADNLRYAIWEMYSNDPLSPEFAAALTDFNNIYSYLSEYEQGFVDAYQIAYNAYLTAFENHSDLRDLLAVDPNYSDFLVFVDNLNWELREQISNIDTYEQYIAMYEEEIMWLMEEIEFPLFLQGFLGDPLNEVAVENVFGYLLDDLQNMVTSMPADSFAILSTYINMVYQTIEPRYYEEPDKGPFEIPFTADEIHSTLTDLSTFLKLRGASLSAEEIAEIESLITNFITGVVTTMNLDGITPEEMATLIEDTVYKYINFADLTLTELTDFIDALTVEEVQMFLDIFEMMETHQLNIYQSVVVISQFIVEVVDPTVDIDLIIDMYLEVWYDMQFSPMGYDPAELIAVQDAWKLYVSDLLTAIGDAALLDASLPIDPLEYPALYELTQRVEYFGLIFHNPPQILDGAYLGYYPDLFYQLLMNMFDLWYEDAVDLAATLSADVFEMTEEETFYLVLGVADYARNINDIQSIGDVKMIFNGLSQLGISNADLAHYAMNAVMTFAYPNLLSNLDTTDLLNMLNSYQIALQNVQTNYDNNMQTVQNEIDLITDQVTHDDVQTLWNLYIQTVEAEHGYNRIYYDVNWRENFNWWIYYDLEYMADMEDYQGIDEYLNGMPNEDYWMYRNLIDAYIYMNQVNWQFENHMNYLDSAYGDIVLISNPYYRFIDYFNDQSWWIWNSLNDLDMYQQMIWNLEDEIQRINDSAWIMETLHDYLSDPANVLEAEVVLSILLDEIESVMTDPNMSVIDFAMMVIPEGKIMFIPSNDIVMELHNLGALFNNMFSTIDPLEKAILNDFLTNMVGYMIPNVTDETDPLLVAAQVLAVQTIIDTYFEDFFTLPGIIGDFLTAYDITKVDELKDSMWTMMDIEDMIRSYLDQGLPVDPLEMSKIIVIADLIYTQLADGTLDYTNLTAPVIMFMYEMSQAVGGNPMTETPDQVMLATLAMLNDVILQGGVVGALDPMDMNYMDGFNLLQEKVGYQNAENIRTALMIMAMSDPLSPEYQNAATQLAALYLTFGPEEMAVVGEFENQFALFMTAAEEIQELQMLVELLGQQIDTILNGPGPV